jgi:SAM-dependent methyltransferase
VSVPSFAARREAWSSPPVDDVGYLPASELLAMPDKEFKRVMDRMWHARYGGWRNHEGRWVEMFGMHAGGVTGKRVLDYGCGVGMEGAQYANLGNEVWLADIVPDNVKVAERLLGCYGKEPAGIFQIRGEQNLDEWSEPGVFDIVHCVGVLHHIPEPVPVVEAMHGWLADGGRLHLMVYSDYAWRIATGMGPNRNIRVEESIFFETFWQHWDPLGGYADWYDEERLAERFGEWFAVERCGYLTPNREYLGAVLVKR